MGRGRAKAKQAKVARQLKYSGADTDLEALRKELVSGSPSSDGGVNFEDEPDDDLVGDDTDNALDDSYGATGGR
jgi:hypothetical protein